MQAFFNLMGLDPEVEEVEAIQMFDQIALNAIAKQQEKEKRAAEKKSRAAKPS